MIPRRTRIMKNNISFKIAFNKMHVSLLSSVSSLFFGVNETALRRYPARWVLITVLILAVLFEFGNRTGTDASNVTWPLGRDAHSLKIGNPREKSSSFRECVWRGYRIF